MATQRPAGTGRHRAQPWWSVWRASFTVGLITTVLGLVVAFRPTQSLSVVMVLFGLLLIISGAYQLARAFDSAERDRVWRGIAAAAFIIAGLVMIRHMHFSLAVIGLVIGVTWVLQGVAMAAMAATIRPRAHAGWAAFFGVVSLTAGDRRHGRARRLGRDADQPGGRVVRRDGPARDARRPAVAARGAAHGPPGARGRRRCLRAWAAQPGRARRADGWKPSDRRPARAGARTRRPEPAPAGQRARPRWRRWLAATRGYLAGFSLAASPGRWRSTACR